MSKDDGIFGNVFHELFPASRASIVAHVLRASRLAPTKYDRSFRTRRGGPARPYKVSKDDGIFGNVFHELFPPSRASIVAHVLRASRLAPTKHDSGFRPSLMSKDDGMFGNVF